MCEDEFAAHPPQQPALGPDDAAGQRVATGKQQGKAAKGVEGLHHRRARRDPSEDCGDRLDGRTNQRRAQEHCEQLAPPQLRAGRRCTGQHQTGGRHQWKALLAAAELRKMITE